jgi:hypothetical protein
MMVVEKLCAFVQSPAAVEQIISDALITSTVILLALIVYAGNFGDTVTIHDPETPTGEMGRDREPPAGIIPSVDGTVQMLVALLEKVTFTVLS